MGPRSLLSTELHSFAQKFRLGAVLALLLVGHVARSDEPKADKAAANGDSAADRQIPFRGLVVDADGRPVFRAKIKIVSTGKGRDPSYDDLNTDPAGTFEVLLSPNRYYAFRAMKDAAISPMECGVVLDDSEPELLTLKLEPAARIRGKVTQGKEAKPVANGSVSLIAVPEVQFAQLPKEVKRRIAGDEPGTLFLAMIDSAKTNEKGEFAIQASRGQYQLNPHAGVPLEQFTVTEPKDYRIDLHIKAEPPVPTTVRVVLRSDPSQTVSGVGVYGQAFRNVLPHRLHGRTGKDGVFTGVRDREKVMVHAFSEDKTLHGVVVSEADETEIQIAIGPTATVKGRLVDGLTGEPIAKEALSAGIPVGRERAFYSNLSFAEVKASTDDKGLFELKGLIVGPTYELYVKATENPRLGEFPGLRRIRLITAETAEPIEVGDVTSTRK